MCCRAGRHTTYTTYIMADDTQRNNFAKMLFVCLSGYVYEYEWGSWQRAQDSDITQSCVFGSMALNSGAFAVGNSGCRRSGIFTAINRPNCNSTSMERRGEPDLFHSLNMYALATTTKPFIFQVLFLNVVCFSSTLLHTTYVCVLCMCCVCERERRLCVGCRCMVTTYAPAFVLK